MSDSTLPAPNPKWMTWTGRVLSALPVLMLIMSGVMKIRQPKEVVEGFGHLGYSMDSAMVLAILELGSTLIYVIPQTAVLGAILLTGYLGGATATHLRVGDPVGQMITPVILGMIVWLGLYLREPRLRALIPWRR
jgi:hypothetical protein